MEIRKLEIDFDESKLKINGEDKRTRRTTPRRK